jgi:putative peptide zinc metalloprotease protein
LTSALIAAAALSLFCFLPLPFHVYCAAEVQPENAVEIRTLVAGRLVRWQKKPGEAVVAGSVIGELENSELKFQISAAEGEVRLSQTILKQLRYDAIANPKFELDIKAQESELLKKQKLLGTILDKQRNLIVRSPAAGYLFPPPEKEDSKAAKSQEQLPGWSGSPFDYRNSEAYFTEGELLGLVGPSQDMECVIVVDQHDREFVVPGSEVEIMFETAMLESAKGKVMEFAKTEMKEAPKSLAIANGGSLDTTTDEFGRTVPISTSYQARVKLEPFDAPLRPGYRGKAKVHLPWKSLGSRLYRYAMKTFNFEF